MRRRRAQRASRSLPPRSKLSLLLYFIQYLSPPPPPPFSLFFGSDCEFKKQNPQQLKEKTHLRHDEKSSAQSIAEFKPSTAGLCAAGGTGQGANAKEPVPGECPGERRTGRSGCRQRLEVTGLFPPTQWTLGSGHLLPALGRRGVGLDLSSFFFSLRKGGRFLSLSLVFIFYFLFEWGWLLCRNYLAPCFCLKRGHDSQIRFEP